MLTTQTTHVNINELRVKHGQHKESKDAKLISQRSYSMTAVAE